MPSASMNSSAERPSQSSIPLQSSKRCLQSRTSINLPQISSDMLLSQRKENWMRQHPIVSTLNLSRMGEKSSHSNLRLCIILSEKNEDAEVRDLHRKLSLSWDIRDRHVRDYLRNSIGFTEVEIKNNIEAYQGRT